MNGSKVKSLVDLLYRHAIDLDLPIKDHWRIEPPVDAIPLDFFERISVSSDEFFLAGEVGPAPGPISGSLDGGFPVLLVIAGVVAPPVGAWTKTLGFVIDNAGDAYCLVKQETAAVTPPDWGIVRFNPNTGAILASALLAPPGPGVFPALVPVGWGGLAIDRTSGTLIMAIDQPVMPGAGLAQIEPYLGTISTAFAGEAWSYCGFKAAGAVGVSEHIGTPRFDPTTGNVILYQQNQPAATNDWCERTTAGVLVSTFASNIPFAASTAIFGGAVVGTQTPRWYWSEIGVLAEKYVSAQSFPLGKLITIDGSELGNPAIGQLGPAGWENSGYAWWIAGAIFMFDPTTGLMRYDSRNDAIALASLYFGFDPTATSKVFGFSSTLPILSPFRLNIYRYDIVYPTAPGSATAQGVTGGDGRLSIWGVITHVSFSAAVGTPGDAVYKFDDGTLEQLGEFPGSNNDPFTLAGPNEYRAVFGFDFDQPITVKLPAPIIIPDQRNFRMLVRKFNAAVVNFDAVLTAHGWQVPEPDKGKGR